MTAPTDWVDNDGSDPPLPKSVINATKLNALGSVVNAKLDTTAAPELIRDTIGTALVAGSNVTITPNDAGDTLTVDANSTAEVLPLEGMPLYLYGHSYLASDMYNTGAGAAGRWAGRVASRARMGAVTTRAVNGARSDQMTKDIAVGNPWTPNTRGAVFLTCTYNDINQMGNAATAVRQYSWSWKSSLSLLRAKAKTASNTADFVYSSTTNWTTSTTNSPIGGTRFQTSTAGDYFRFNVTGNVVDVYLTTRSAGAGLVTFTVGGTTVGTLDLTGAASVDYSLAVANLTGLGSGTHTVTGTLTSGTYLGVEAISVPSETPPLVVVFGEGTVLRYGAADVPTYNAYLTGTYLPALSSACALYPNVVYVGAGSDWDSSTMLRPDAVVAGDQLVHPNDEGASHIAGKVLTALAATPWSNGLNTLGAQPTYTPPAAPSVPDGGRTGATAGPTIPTPLAHYDFHETSGATATDLEGNWPALAAANTVTSWSGAAAAGQFTLTAAGLASPWTMSFDTHLPTSPAGTWAYWCIWDSAAYMFTTLASGKMEFYTFGTGVIQSADGASPVGDHILTWVSTGSAVILYADGVQVATGSGSIPTLNDAVIAATGDFPAGSLIRDIRVWDSVLTDTQIAAL